VGYYPHILGEWKERQAAARNLGYYTIAVAIAIFLLLQASFRNWRLAILTFLALPAALVGGVLAAYAADGIISLGSLVGFLTVLGVAARNGILMISHYQHLEREEGEPFGLGLVTRGALERLSPILMTTLCTGHCSRCSWCRSSICGSVPLRWPMTAWTGDSSWRGRRDGETIDAFRGRVPAGPKQGGNPDELCKGDEINPRAEHAPACPHAK
jgi:hypothetical protein